VIGRVFLSVYAGLCDLSHMGCTEAAQHATMWAIGEANASPGYPAHEKARMTEDAIGEATPHVD
jgi:hypothetical protein